MSYRILWMHLQVHVLHHTLAAFAGSIEKDVQYPVYEPVSLGGCLDLINAKCITEDAFSSKGKCFDQAQVHHGGFVLGGLCGEVCRL